MKLNQNGFSLMQVMIVQAVALVILGLIMPLALRSSRVASSSTAKSSLQALATRVKFSLGDSDACVTNLTLNPAALNTAVHPTTGINEVQVLDQNTGATLLQSFILSPNYTRTSEYYIKSAQIQVTTIFPRTADLDGVGGVEHRFLANLVITAALGKPGITDLNFLGAPQIQEVVPMFIQTGNGNKIDACSSRSKYAIAIGPSTGSQKSALECYDRDGVPVQTTGASSYYVCQIPYTPNTIAQVMFANGCSTGGSSPGYLNIEGWNNAPAAPPANFLWCI